MTRKQRTIEPDFVPNAPVETTPEPMFTVKLEVIGAEPVILNGMNVAMMSHVSQWFSGTGHWALEVPVGNSVIVLDRTKVGYIFISPQGETGEENNG